jgi:hypothetical protein
MRLRACTSTIDEAREERAVSDLCEALGKTWARQATALPEQFIFPPFQSAAPAKLQAACKQPDFR